MNIRNFCIIAHVDHGKSTLADRLIERTGALTAREMTEQVLDQMDLERERGITIKMQAVRLRYRAQDGQQYILNLIDTPGHVDFSYEVSRSLAACEGALLVVDATQGIEAQTVAHYHLAQTHGLTIVPVINKIDLPSADPDRVRQELEDVLGLRADNALLVSAKTGLGTDAVLEAIVQRIPPPQGHPERPLRALVFDSLFDSYRGVIAYVRVIDGVLRTGDRIRLMRSGKEYEVSEVDVSMPALRTVPQLQAGEVGSFSAQIRNLQDVRVGETITTVDNPAAEPLPGYEPAKPMVYCGLYPVDNEQYGDLREALEKLQLNDAALVFEPETSVALGFGFRCGFLGLLHMDIVQERLEREYGLNLIATAPSVVYHVLKTNGELVEVDNPAAFPPAGEIEAIEEPYVRAQVIVPDEYVGPIMELCQQRRGQYESLEYVSTGRALLTYGLPLSEIILDFFDKLKSKSRGYASLDYHYSGHRPADLVRLDILLNGKPVDALCCIVHRDQAAGRGRQLVERLREVIPRQLFEVPIQAAIGSRVVARQTVGALRKDVLAKCYGGDISRKKKLLEKQREGKRRMKRLGTVDVPQEAFLAVLKLEDQ